MSIEIKLEARIQSILEELVINNQLKSRSMIRESIKSSSEAILRRVTVMYKLVIEDEDIFRVYILLKLPIISRQSVLYNVSSQFLNETKLQYSFT